MSSELHSADARVFHRIRNLKLRQLRMSTEQAKSILGALPNLVSLDISHTNVHFSANLFKDSPPPLEKLSLNSTPTTGSELLSILPHIMHLKTLNLAALGPSAERSVLRSISFYSLSPRVLRELTNVLSNCDQIERINLAGNVGITAHEKSETISALVDFLSRVGRRCKVC